MERSAALGVRLIRAGTTRDNSYDHTRPCADKNPSSRECVGLSRARDTLLFAVLARCRWRDWTCVSSEHDATARCFPDILRTRPSHMVAVTPSGGQRYGRPDGCL
jgi:hypothetical protein